MKILILGGTGMLGSEIVKQCINRKIDWHTTIREKNKLYNIFGDSIISNYSLINDAKEFSEFELVIKQYKPDVIINCIGIVKQSELSKNYIESIFINSLTSSPVKVSFSSKLAAKR
jgi:dTDP-4-dehydrorhamnose reductase